MKKILVAVDGSLQSLHAARLALELAEALKATVTAIYSVPPVMVPGEVPFTVVNDVQQAGIAAGKELLAEVVKQLDGKVTALEVEGDPASRIAEVAETEGFDLVVVGSRGRHAVARMLLGSVADRLVHVCKKPVLVVR
jgi:nucleotide-binding universal stress UspA family protein